MRYANTRGLCELMANACNIFPPYSESIRECLLEINKTAEKAMARSLSGDATGAVRSLLRHGAQTLNTKLVDLSQQVLLRHRDRIEESDALQQEIDALRERCGVAPPKAVLGQDSERHPGGLSFEPAPALPTATSPPSNVCAPSAQAQCRPRAQTANSRHPTRQIPRQTSSAPQLTQRFLPGIAGCSQRS